MRVAQGMVNGRGPRPAKEIVASGGGCYAFGRCDV